MQHLDKHSNLVRRAPRQAALVTALAVACIAMGSAHAQVFVTDTPTETAASTTATESAAMHVFQTGTQYANFVAQLTQLTSTLSSIASNPLGAILPPNSVMSELSDSTRDQLIQGKCYSATSGGIVGGVLQGISSAVSSIGFGGNITQTQQSICSSIVYAQVDEYNATVDLYQQMPQLRSDNTQVQSLVQQLNGVMGNSSSSSAQTLAVLQAHSQQVTEWQTRVGMDQKLIETLNQQQSTLSAIALRGNPNILGDAVQAGALKLALSIND
ncbi:hypothetical protein [Rhodanobacter sp. MP1X3]|uniref:hypothetical protein n=1 Tax=Rhodanobacter sp. MP1X3 TaxID=2723086 RepID=UPI00160B69EB|nr:hypothetical protein [Rhodanobacter sp. MP1X3]MBB6241391.1 hypothetical protein [Rhodanobacter sp. MP1X3]